MIGRPLLLVVAVGVLVAVLVTPAVGSKSMFNRPNIVVVERPWPPLIDVWVQIPVGALADPGGREGLAHLAWQVAIEAGGNRNKRRFNEALDRIGATLDAEVGAHETVVFGQVPTKNLERFMELLSDVIRRPRFSRTDVALHRGLAIADAEEIYDDAAALAHDAARRYLNRGTPAGRPIHGTPATLKKLRASHLRSFHRRATANTLRFGFAGDVPRQTAVRLVRENFPKMNPRSAAGNRKVRLPIVKGRRLLIVDRPGRSQAHVVILLPTAGANRPVMPQLSVAIAALGGTFTSRLVRQVRELRGWAYSIDATLRMAADRGLVEIDWAPDNRVAAASIDLVMRQVELLREAGLTSPELAFARDHLRGAHQLAIETAAGELSERMRSLALGLTIDFPQRLSALIARVESNHVNAALTEYLDPSHAVAVVVGDAKVLKPSFDKLASGFAVEVIPYNGAPETTSLVGNAISRTRPVAPPAADPARAEPAGPIFDEHGNPVDPASLPAGDTAVDDADAVDDSAGGDAAPPGPDDI